MHMPQHIIIDQHYVVDNDPISYTLHILLGFQSICSTLSLQNWSIKCHSFLSSFPTMKIITKQIFLMLQHICCPQHVNKK